MKIWLVDAFTAKTFQGNPAGVCLVDHFPKTKLMQTIAAEMNWSQTAFITQETDNHFHIRWFSPKDEAPLCGHATLAAAHILWQEKRTQSQILTFDSLGGLLKAEKKRNGPDVIPDARFSSVSPGRAEALYAKVEGRTLENLAIRDPENPWIPASAGMTKERGGGLLKAEKKRNGPDVIPDARFSSVSPGRAEALYAKVEGRTLENLAIRDPENPWIPASAGMTKERGGGLLKAEKKQDEWIYLNFPTRPVVACALPDSLQQALGGITVQSVYKDDTVYLVVLRETKDVVRLKPNLSLIEQIDCRAIIVTALGESPYDFVSRYFAPKVGIPEDPVCGSAHCRLIPFWSKILEKNDLLAYQASPRGGILRLSLTGDRVLIGGQAVTVSEGYLRV